VKPLKLLEEATGSSDLRLCAFVLGCCAVSLLAAWLWALAPDISYDALNYQLGIPQIYLQNHGLVEVPYSFWSYLLGSTGMLYSLGLSLAGQPLPQFIHLVFGVLLAVMTFLYGRRRANARVGLIAAGLFYTLPFVTWESRTAFVDLIVALYAFGAAYAGSTWFETRSVGWLRIAGLMSGFALAAKLNVVAMLVPLALVVIIGILTSRVSIRQLVGAVCNLAIPAAIVSAPWFVIRMVWTGNPVFPFLNGLFRSARWPAVNETFNFATYGMGRSFASFIKLPWNLSVHADRFNEGPGGTLGVLPLLALMSLLLVLVTRQRRVIVLPAAITIAGLVIWFETAQIARFVLMFAPLAAVLAAQGIEFVYQTFETRRVTAAIARVVAAAAALALLFAAGLVVILFGRSIPERFPYRVALGSETREQFLSRALPVYDALSFLNDQDGGRAKVLSIGNELRLYSTAQIEGVTGSPEAGKVLAMSTAPEVVAFLTTNGYRYILINQPNAQKIPGKVFILRSDFLTKHARIRFARNNVYIYEVLPADYSLPAIDPSPPVREK
jgi:hypothetical protein